MGPLPAPRYTARVFDHGNGEYRTRVIDLAADTVDRLATRIREYGPLKPTWITDSQTGLQGKLYPSGYVRWNRWRKP